MAERAQRSFLDPQALARLVNLPLHARAPMEGSMTGLHKSPHRGASVEFAEYRKYVPGDDIRHIDWRVYGRTDRFYMKEFEADTNLRCYLVLDCSASMGFPGGNASKFAYAQRLAATIAYLLVQQGDAVGLLGYSNKPLCDIPPRRNPSHLAHLFDALETLQPTDATSLAPLLHELAEKIRRRALVLVFSDLFSDVAELLGCFQHLRFQKHDLALFHLLDRRELDFQFDRPVRFVDLESPATMITEPALIRPRYLESIQDYLTRLRSGCREFGADYRLVVTDEDYEQIVAEFLTDRARKKGQASGH